MEKSHIIGPQKGNLLLLLLAAVFLTSLLVNSMGSAATLPSFQSPISPISPVISPPEPVAGPTATPIPQPSAPAVASNPVFWIVIGLVVVGTFAVGLVFFQKRRE
jgi:hypothetical protein